MRNRKLTWCGLTVRHDQEVKHRITTHHQGLLHIIKTLLHIIKTLLHIIKDTTDHQDLTTHHQGYYRSSRPYYTSSRPCHVSTIRHSYSSTPEQESHIVVFHVIIAIAYSQLASIMLNDWMDQERLRV